MLPIDPHKGMILASADGHAQVRGDKAQASMYFVSLYIQLGWVGMPVADVRRSLSVLANIGDPFGYEGH